MFVKELKMLSRTLKWRKQGIGDGAEGRVLPGQWWWGWK
jgi:hypothetical protein